MQLTPLFPSLVLFKIVCQPSSEIRDSSLHRRSQSGTHISSNRFCHSSSGISSSQVLCTPCSCSTLSKVLRTIIFPSKLSFLRNKQHWAIISLNVSPCSVQRLVMSPITVSTFLLIFLFLVTWPRQELSISDTDDTDRSGDEDVEGELSVAEKLELAGVEHFGGLSRMFGALFEKCLATTGRSETLTSSSAREKRLESLDNLIWEVVRIGRSVAAVFQRDLLWWTAWAVGRLTFICATE